MNRMSESQVRSLEVREKYQSFVGNQKVQQLSSLRKKDAEESLYVHPLVKRIEKRMDKYNVQNAR